MNIPTLTEYVERLAEENTVKDFVDVLAVMDAGIEAGTAAPPVCGENHVFPARLAGCGESISSWQEVYRCTHCDIPFHKDCANRHFSDQSITKDQIDSMSDAEVAHAYAVLHGGAM